MFVRKFVICSTVEMFDAIEKVKEEFRIRGIAFDIIKRVQTVLFEGISNGIVHVGEVQTEVFVFEEVIKIRFKDKGEGIPDIRKAFEKGYSTVSPRYKKEGFGAGMGLDNILSNADTVYVATGKGCGTEVAVNIDLI